MFDGSFAYARNVDDPAPQSSVTPQKQPDTTVSSSTTLNGVIVVPPPSNGGGTSGSSSSGSSGTEVRLGGPYPYIDPGSDKSSPGYTITSVPATFTPPSPTGSVSYSYDGSVRQTNPIDNVSSWIVLFGNGFTAGDHVVALSYSGDAAYDASTASTPLHINTGVTTTAVNVQQLSADGGRFSLTAETVGAEKAYSGTRFTGKVSFYDDGTLLTTVDAGTDAGTVTLTTGTHHLTASYVSDVQAFRDSDSAVYTLEVGTINLTALHPVLFAGETQVLNAVITGSSGVSGTVDFKEGDTVLGTAPIVNGQASLSLTGLAGGVHRISAQINGVGLIDYASAITVAVDAALGSGELIPTYQLFSDVTLERLYTSDANEDAVLATRGWRQEGVACDVLSAPVTIDGVTAKANYRLYNPYSRQHLLTTDVNEYATLSQGGAWEAEGIMGYVLDTPAVAAGPAGGVSTISTLVYRLYNPANGGIHLWTTDRHEYATLAEKGWQQEGVIADVIDASGY